MSTVIPASPGKRIRQSRGRKTYDALIATGFRLLERKEFESITIAELTQAAGYSVGAFYARFRSKNELFDAMIAHHLEHRTKVRDRLLATVSIEDLVNELIEELVGYYWKRRRFWRAALVRSIRDPGFWEPISQHGRDLANLLISRISQHAQRKLTANEDMNVRFAFQLVLGTINNAIINSPGPIFIGQALFVENLARAFRVVIDYDALVGPPSRGNAPASVSRKR